MRPNLDLVLREVPFVTANRNKVSARMPGEVPVDLTEMFWDASDSDLGNALALTPEEQATGVHERDLYGGLNVRVCVGDKVGLAIHMVKVFVMVVRHDGPLTMRHWEEIADLYLARRHLKCWATVLDVKAADGDDEEDESYLVRADDPHVCPSYCLMRDPFWVKRRTVFKVHVADSNH